MTRRGSSNMSCGLKSVLGFRVAACRLLMLLRSGGSKLKSSQAGVWPCVGSEML